MVGLEKKTRREIRPYGTGIEEHRGGVDIELLRECLIRLEREGQVIFVDTDGSSHIEKLGPFDHCGVVPGQIRPTEDLDGVAVSQ